MAILLDKIFASIALSHFIIDIMNGQRGVLLAYLSVPLMLSNTAVGLVGLLYQLVAAILQPFTGYVADKAGPRWLVAGGVLWMGLFFSLAITVPGYASLAFLVLASLGSGMFHPAGSMQSSLIGRDRLGGKEDTPASLFFFFGQFGYFVGPLLGGPILGLWGPAGLLLLTIFVLPIGSFGGWQLRKIPRPVLQPSNPGSRFQLSSLSSQKWYILMLLIIATCQSWEQQNMQIFVPKYLNDMGLNPGIYGLLSALFMGGSALGNVIGGQIANRFGRKAVIVGGLAIVSIPVYLITKVGVGPWLFWLIPIAGLFSGAAYTCIFVASQQVIPGAMGLVSGLILSFMFSSGSLGTLISGFIADKSGFASVFYLTSGLALLGAVVALTINNSGKSVAEAKQGIAEYSQD